MLRHEREVLYCVYPSWAEHTYSLSWKELIIVLRDPTKDALGRELMVDFSISGQLPKEQLDFEQVDGPVGGGILVRRSISPWIGLAILRKAGANFGPIEMRAARATFPTYVTFIEPYSSSSSKSIGASKHRNAYVCGATAEHSESAGDNIYWAFDVKDGLTDVEIASIITLAASFGMAAILSLPADLPVPFQQEMQYILNQTSDKLTWFNIKCIDDRAGFHFSILLYVGLHVRRTSRRLKWVHLVAQIEGRPRIRNLRPTP